MISVFIVEDEKNIQDELMMLLKEENDVTVLGACTSVKDALIILPSLNVDLVLMDIQLDDGKSFEILENLKEIAFDVIFITAYDEYAIRAIKIGAIDYILKPVDTKELSDAIDAFRRKKSKQILQEQKTLLLNHTDKNSVVKKITLKTLEQIFFVDLSQIKYCKGDGSYTTFFLENHKEIICSKPLKEFETILPSESFVKTHQSFIINKRSVDYFSHNHGVVLKDGTPIPVSVRRKIEVLNLLAL